jgi:methyl coenzyme M reductase subunit D
LSLHASALTLVEDGVSEYSIVLPADAIASEQFAAEELASHIEQITGAKLPIVIQGDSLPEHAILLGPANVDKPLGKEEYV